MSESRTIEERILDQFFSGIGAETSIPQEVLLRLRELREEGQLTNGDAIIAAVRQGVADHAQNSTT